MPDDHQTTIEIWRGNTALVWRTDAFGKQNRALFAGGIHIGHIFQWSGTDNPHYGDWRAWLMTDEDGTQVGWFKTEQDAKDALVDAAVKALAQ